MAEVKIATQTMAMAFDRKVYFDAVRASLFQSGMTQQQVDGQEMILTKWETEERASDDLRHLSYMLATTKHETASTMWPIKEYEGEHASYGQPDPVTGESYYGRGDVQLTHRDNYARADEEMGWTGDESCEHNADLQLQPEYAVPTMFWGMWEGWFRSGNTLDKFFNETIDDPFNAREIINGDKNYHVSWDSRVIGEIIAGYHDDFLDALESAYTEDAPQPRPPRPPLPPIPEELKPVVLVEIRQPFGVQVEVKVIEAPPPDWDALRQRFEQWRLKQPMP